MKRLSLSVVARFDTLLSLFPAGENWALLAGSPIRSIFGLGPAIGPCQVQLTAVTGMRQVNLAIITPSGLQNTARSSNAMAGQLAELLVKEQGDGQTNRPPLQPGAGAGGLQAEA